MRKVRLKHVASVRPSNVDKKAVDGQEPVQLCNYTDVYYQEYIRSGLKFMSATATRDQVASFELQRGDVLITKDSETAGDIAVPALVTEDLFGVLCGYHLALVRRNPEAVDSRFLYRALSSDYVNRQFEVGATGVTRYGLRTDVIRSIRVPCHSLDVQKLIADFLDRETHRIDALVDAKRRMIELLEEKRDSERNHLVFRGSSKTANGWRDLPKDWTSRSVKYVASLKSGTNITSDEIEEDSGPYPVYGGNGLRGYTYDFTHKGRHVLVGRQGALAGNINYSVDGPFFASEHAVVATPLIDAPSTWLGETLRAMNLNQYSTTAAQPGLAVEFIGRLKMPVPSPDERHRIAYALDRLNHLFGSLVHAVKSQLDLLAEYRQALITQAVTGQLDEATLMGHKQVDEAVGVIPE